MRYCWYSKRAFGMLSRGVFSDMSDKIPPPLLALPLELREIVYKEVMLDPSQGPQILQACRSIYSEAREYLYQRPVAFESQTSLQEWLKHRAQDVLKEVHEVLLQLQDVDLTPILVSVPSNTKSERSRSLRTWELYEREIDALGQAFKQLPNVKVVTIRALNGQQTHLYDDFLAKVLQMLATHWPALQDLSLEGNMHNQRLDFLQGLKELSSFSYDGFSASDTAETAAILSKLNLRRISIVSRPILLTPTHGRNSSFTFKPQSFDGSVLRTANQLGSFAIIEYVPTLIPSALFFTPEVLASLSHHKSLSTLSLRLSRIPDEDTLETLNRFLSKSDSVERLELDWPHLDLAIPDIPATRLKSLWLRASSLSTATKILKAILMSKEDGSAQLLRRVVLIRDDWTTGTVVKEAYSDEESSTEDVEDDAQDVAEAHFASLKISLNELGVEVAWHTETC